MKIVRRIHMYLGLLLVPWVVLFGIGGFFFNHTSTFWGGTVETVANIPAKTTQKKTAFQPLETEEVIEEILKKINADGTEIYSLKGSPWMHGDLKFTGRSGKQTMNVSIDMENGETEVTQSNRPRVEQEKPAFDKQAVSLPFASVDTLAEQFKGLLANEGIEIEGGLQTPSRGSNAEIRFLVTDSNGRDWRASYKFADSTLSAVADDSDSGLTFYSAVTRLHKTHHYPDNFGARWVWSFIGDITAISMVVWGLSGLVMWWQIQPTRALGTIAIFIAAIVSFIIFSGTLADYTHNPAQIRTRG